MVPVSKTSQTVLSKHCHTQACDGKGVCDLSFIQQIIIEHAVYMLGISLGSGDTMLYKTKFLSL